MEAIQLTRLEAQIDQLLRQLEELQTENRCLREQLSRHAREKSTWYHQNRKVAGEVKKVIGNLKEVLA